MSETGYWKKGAWIEPSPKQRQKLEINNNNDCTTTVRLNGEVLKLISYSISHTARELPIINLRLSGSTNLDISENADGEIYLDYKGMRFKRIE